MVTIAFSIPEQGEASPLKPRDTLMYPFLTLHAARTIMVSSSSQRLLRFEIGRDKRKAQKRMRTIQLKGACSRWSVEKCRKDPLAVRAFPI